MSFLRKDSSGNYYVCKRTSGSNKGRYGKHNYRDWWLPKWSSGLFISFSILTIPNELEGKKLRFKVEVLEDETDTK